MNETPKQLQFVHAHQVPGIEHRLDYIVPWVRDSDRRYYEVLLADHDIDATLRRWMQNPDSELALQKTRLLIADDLVAGGYVGFAGRQLLRRREADLIDLARAHGNLRCPNMRQAIQRVHPLMGSVAPNDFYLSKIGVTAELRGRELEPTLLDACFDQAQAAGFDHMRIDIDDGDDFTRTLCTAKGFETLQKRRSPAVEIGYVQMVKAL